jgi:branched-chain amino acid transport system ATP-binding protein
VLKAHGQTVPVIDRNVGNPCRIADCHYIIERGRTVWSGTSEHLTAEPDLSRRLLSLTQADTRSIANAGKLILAGAAPDLW